MPSPHKVAIVVDWDFGSRLEVISRSVHVWICDSPSNQKGAQAIWASRSGHDLESGVTTFDAIRTDSAESMILKVLPTIDLHHGEYSHDPPWTVMNVYGTALTPGLEAALRELGVTQFESLVGGFSCRRALHGAV